MILREEIPFAKMVLEGLIWSWETVFEVPFDLTYQILLFCEDVLVLEGSFMHSVPLNLFLVNMLTQGLVIKLP